MSKEIHDQIERIMAIINSYSTMGGKTYDTVLEDDLSSNILRQIKLEAAFMYHEHQVANPGLIGEGIFDLLKKVGTLILYPFDDKDFKGLYHRKNIKHYFVINSAMKLEHQILTGAHCLGFSLGIVDLEFKTITSENLNIYFDHRQYHAKADATDKIAYRFAMELLLEDRKLIKQLDNMDANKCITTKAVLLSEVLMLPYKTIISRIDELGLIDDGIEEDFLHDDDYQGFYRELLDEDESVLNTIRERYELSKKNLLITREINYGGYIDKAIVSYQQGLSSYKELTERLQLVGKKPEDFSS